MTFSIDQQFESFLPVYDVVPEKWEDARAFLVEQLKKMSNAINAREIGWFIDEEVLSGKSFIPAVSTINNGFVSNIYRQVLRKVIDFGPLPDTALKSVPHGISVTPNFTLVQMYAAATDPVSLFSLPIPFVSAPNVSTSNIQMFMDATQIYIRTSDSRSSYTRCFVTIEYLQEV